mmetsp:Transcript_7628/g.22041  ORF Transcript_7628/g.22041 Transcript_7628/m.22041 type:complete len:364 (-) Transcript_7628:200-1291(-)
MAGRSASGGTLDVDASGVLDRGSATRRPMNTMSTNLWQGQVWDSLPSRQQVQTQVIASGCGSVVVGLILTPVQVMKVRWQMLTDLRPPRTGPGATVAAAAPQHANLGSLVTHIYRNEGLLAFWRGLNTMLLMQAPSTAVYMVCYEALKNITRRSLPDEWCVASKYLSPILSGSLGRVVAATAFAPLELIRTNQSAGRAKTIWETAQSILRNRGFMGLYAGLMPTLYRDVPFSAVYWLAFEEGKIALRDSGLPQMRATPLRGIEDGEAEAQPSTVAVFLAAATGGAMAALVTHPFDTIKTRLQVAVTDAKISGVAPPTSMSVVRGMGISIFYRGLGLRLMQIIPGTSSMMITYSLVKRAMGEAP